MIDQSDLHGNVVPFCRRWHVIHEVDLVRLASDRASLRLLCDELEACADALPHAFSAQQMQSLCERLRDFVRRHEAGDTASWKAMFGRDWNDRLTRTLLSHVQARRAVDASHALDLIAALDPQAADHDRFSVEALAYMLRCFFDGRRRAMDFEELTILMLGGNRLTPDARAFLIDGLSRTTAA